MMKKISLLIFLLLMINIFTSLKYSMYDTISGATSSTPSTTTTSSTSSTSSSVDKSGISQKRHKSNSFKIILNEDQKNKNEGLKTQIDDCLDAVKSIKRAINNNQKEFDLLQIRTIIENNNLLISKFNKDESNQIDYILNKTNLNIKKINEILVKYDKEKIDVASLNNLKKNIDALSSQYRAIQWILYL